MSLSMIPTHLVYRSRALISTIGAALVAFAGGCAGASTVGGEGGGGPTGSSGEQMSFSGSSPSASVEATYRPDQDGVVFCAYIPSGSGGPQLSINAGRAFSSKGFSVSVTLKNIAALEPFQRTDTWSDTGGDFLANFWFDEQYGYNYFYDCFGTQGTTCTTKVTALSSSHLSGTIDCTGLVPRSGSPDFALDCSVPSPHATTSIAFDCDL